MSDGNQGVTTGDAEAPSDGSPRDSGVLARVIVAVSLLLALAVGLGVAAATHSPSALGTVVSSYAVKEPLCTINDPRLTGISGIASRGDGLWAINDRGAILYNLGPECQVEGEVDLASRLKKAGVAPVDVEDLAITNDGWLWMSDTGGNVNPRKSIRLIGWRDEQTPILIRDFKYPDGPHDVEAVAIDLMGRAVLVTKVPGEKGLSRVYRTPDSVFADRDGLLDFLGELVLEKPEGTGPGSRLVTGAAVSPGGFVTLRTYTNAWEFDAFDGDLARAIVERQPRLIPLPESEQGEAITYHDLGKTLLATGEGSPVALDRVEIERTMR